MIAQALERSPDVAESAPEVLAQHLPDAGLVERAVPYWGRAGELAAGRSANLEAIAHLSKGLELVGRPISRLVNLTMRSRRWIKRPRPAQRPARASIKQNCTG